jgi:hypothetical protein
VANGFHFWIGWVGSTAFDIESQTIWDGFGHVPKDQCIVVIGVDLDVDLMPE